MLAVIKITGCTSAAVGVCVLLTLLEADDVQIVCARAPCQTFNHSEQLFDRQMYLQAKSMTPNALIIQTCVLGAEISSSAESRWVI